MALWKEKSEKKAYFSKAVVFDIVYIFIAISMGTVKYLAKV